LATLDVSRLVTVGVAPVRLRDREHHLLGDVTRVRTLGPQVERPSTLPVAGRLLQIVHHAALAQDQGRNVLRPAVQRNALDTHLHAKLPAGLPGVTALAPNRELETTSLSGRTPTSTTRWRSPPDSAPCSSFFILYRRNNTKF
jgi:hypothetical protein